MTRAEAAATLAFAEAAGFVREPSTSFAYEEYLIDDAHEALEWMAARSPATRDEHPTHTQDRLFNAPATMAGQLNLGGIE